MAFPTCTADAIADRINCLGCLSGQELDAIKVLLLCQLVDGTCTPKQLIDDAAPFNLFNNDQLKRAEVALLCELATSGGKRSDCTATTLRDEARCLSCVPEHTLKAIALRLYCQYYSSL